MAWLAKATPSDEVQTKLWRLLPRQKLGASASLADPGGSQGDEAATALSQQPPDGGWVQTSALPSDAYATGQVLYFLDLLHIPLASQARDKASSFYFSLRKPDGTGP